MDGNWTYRFFSPSALEPCGWMDRQLRLQAEGLCGHLDQVWPDIRDSRWIGGDREGWERVPYWLDGFINLAWLLKDKGLQQRACRYIEAILAQQQPDGWICPCADEERSHYDIWAAFLICKVLVHYENCTADPRVEEAVYRAMQRLYIHMENHSLFNWAAARWFECLIPLLWLYERRPEPWMKDMAACLKMQGFDYDGLLKHWPYHSPQEKGRWNLMTHVVNLAMALRSEALYCAMMGTEDTGFASRMLETLLQDHGMPIGHFTGDECLSGNDPTRGTELCGVVEAMYSYEVLLALTGEDRWTDQLEKLAFNALPAAISPDMWTHQYDQMSNQIQCSQLSRIHFQTNNHEAHMFGLEPHFGCCTANFGQGWPLLARTSILKSENGLAVGAIVPCRLNTVIEGVPVICTIETNYPFNDGYRVVVKTESPVRFELSLRIPAGAKNAYVDKRKMESQLRCCISRVWEGEQTIDVRFSYDAVMEDWADGMAYAARGPLVFALPIGERWERREYSRDGVERKYPYCDYEIFPTTAWNYAFADDELEWIYTVDGDMSFSPEHRMARLRARVQPIDWPAEDGICRAYPGSAEAVGPVQDVDLIPYGCTNLRMTVLPLAEKKKS